MLNYSAHYPSSFRKAAVVNAPPWLPRMWRMIRDILRLYDHARRRDHASEVRSLDDFLRAEGYSSTFREDHILPMCAAIWSCSPAAALAFLSTAASPLRSAGPSVVSHLGWRS